MKQRLTSAATLIGLTITVGLALAPAAHAGRITTAHHPSDPSTGLVRDRSSYQACDYDMADGVFLRALVDSE
ncbi:MAG TPA: hypothetical protein VF526_15205 [Solirubrobacteraceae bacterium]|jgi:hypothetical protein